MNDANMQGVVAEEVNKRLNKATQDLAEKYARGEGGHDTSETGPTGEAYKQKHREDAAKKKSSKPSASAEPPSRSEASRGEEEDDLEEDAAEDGDHELREIRQQRLKMLQQQQREKLENLGKGHGQYREIFQDDFLAEVTGSLHVVCHFYHRDFPRCEIMNNHIIKLAPRHIEAKFVKINADKAPFFVEKLKIRTMPTLVLFTDGVAKDKVIGFEGLSDSMPEGREDEWPTARLARVLASAGMIRKDLIQDDENDKVEQQRKMMELRRHLMTQNLDDDDDLSD